MESQTRNKVQIYNLTPNNANLPAFLSERARRNLQKTDSQYRQRVHLLTDTEFPCASTKIRQSPNGQYIVASGTYRPRIRMYELSEYTMKFERFLDADVVDQLFLSEDYGKLAMLQSNRTVSFHAPYGAHASIQIPKFGRALQYEKSTCHLLIPSSGTEIYRFDLEAGRFAQSMFLHASQKEDTVGPNSSPEGCSSIAVSPSHPLGAVGAEDGVVRFFDLRSSGSPGPLINLDVKPHCVSAIANEIVRNPSEVTSVNFDSTGMYFVCGTANGTCILYDLRSSQPLHVKEHQYGLPIHTCQFHKSSGTILSSDSRLIKIWRSKPSSSSGLFIDDEATAINNSSSLGSIVTNIEGKGDFNHFLVSGDEADPEGHNSGLILCATEQPQMQSFYCPALGKAPRWCSFLDNITEELEERETKASENGDVQTQSVYEDYKFVSRDEVEKLGIGNLVGTPLLKGYMHGFFIDTALYNKVKAVANPFEYEEYRKKKVREKLEEKRASLIAPKKKKSKPAVNPDFAARLEQKATKGSKTGETAKAMLQDNRFSGLFDNPDFEIDEENEQFKLRNASGVAKIRNDDDMDSDNDYYDEQDGESDSESGFQRVGSSGEMNDYDDDVDSDSDSDSDDDGFRGVKVRGENYEALKSQRRAQEENEIIKSKSKKEKKDRKQKNTMYEADAYGDAEKSALAIGLGDKSAQKDSRRRKAEASLSLEERLAMKKDSEKNTMHIRSQGAQKEVSYIPKDVRRKIETDGSQNEYKRGSGRRGVSGLKKRGRQ